MLTIFKYNISAKGRTEEEHITASEWSDSQNLAIKSFQKKYFETKGFYPQIVQISCVETMEFTHSIHEAAINLRDSEKSFVSALRTRDHSWISGMANNMKQAQKQMDKIIFLQPLPPKEVEVEKENQQEVE